mmetsp:Transcript_11805/g.17535  ORF Transcript_11805/g.17535 Transcript_11805/m.17535 type:complete len:413 (+) Transcript_11805:16-1254(+)
MQSNVLTLPLGDIGYRRNVLTNVPTPMVLRNYNITEETFQNTIQDLKQKLNRTKAESVYFWISLGGFFIYMLSIIMFVLCVIYVSNVWYSFLGIYLLSTFCYVFVSILCGILRQKAFKSRIDKANEYLEQQNELFYKPNGVQLILSAQNYGSYRYRRYTCMLQISFFNSPSGQPTYQQQQQPQYQQPQYQQPQYQQPQYQQQEPQYQQGYVPSQYVPQPYPQPAPTNYAPQQQQQQQHILQTYYTSHPPHLHHHHHQQQQQQHQSPLQHLKTPSSTTTTTTTSTTSTKGRKKWSPYYDNLLVQAVKKFNGRHWAQIAQYVGGSFTSDQCNQHWHRVLKPSIRKGEWDDEEINELKRYVEKYGEHSWSRVAEHIPTRTDVQCRCRWKIMKKEQASSSSSSSTTTSATIIKSES